MNVKEIKDMLRALLDGQQNLDARMKAMEERMDRLEGRMTAIEEKLERMDKVVTYLAGDVYRLKIKAPSK